MNLRYVNTIEACRCQSSMLVDVLFGEFLLQFLSEGGALLNEHVFAVVE